MAGRNDAAIAAALEAVAQALGQQPKANAGANAEVRMLETFLRNHPRTLKGRYDPDGAQTCQLKVQKVRFGTHMLAKEADDWWIGFYLFQSKMVLRLLGLCSRESEAEFLSTKQLKQLERDGIMMFSLMASLSIENQAVIDKLQVFM